jgi:AhpD family alkylhydroperoxidase
MTRYEQFQAYRSMMNNRILGDDQHRHRIVDKAPTPTPQGEAAPMGGTLVTKRFFRLDGQSYEPGALPAPTKELLGLVASMVLRCDDCIAYHIDQCVKAGISDEQLWEAFDIALIVGGSIVIPHLRRGVEFLDECRAQKQP